MKQLIPSNLIRNKNKQTKKKRAEDLESPLSKEDIQISNKHRKRCSISFMIREMKIKTTLTDHLTLVRMTIIKKNLQTINAGEDVEKRQHSCTVDGNVN